MWEGYNQKYPYLRHENQKYRGRFKVDDRPDILGGMTVSGAIRSGTRQWAIFLKLLYQKLHAKKAFHLLHGVSVNTGGGATKVCRLGRNIRYVKEMPVFPPIFQLVMDEGAIPIGEMFADFNCGIGLDIIGSAEGGILAGAIESVCDMAQLRSWALGFCETCNKPKNEVVITSPYGGMTYTPK
jgi:phosphoribosylaminoimidazole (AIR) synthetase